MTKVKLDDKSLLALARRARSAPVGGVVSQDKKLGEQKLGMFAPIRPRMGSEAVEAVSTLSRTSGARGRMASRSFSQNMADGSVQTKGLGQQLREPSESFFGVGNFERDGVRSPASPVFAASSPATSLFDGDFQPVDTTKGRLSERNEQAALASRKAGERGNVADYEGPSAPSPMAKTLGLQFEKDTWKRSFSADRGGFVSNAKRTRSAGRGGTVRGAKKVAEDLMLKRQAAAAKRAATIAAKKGVEWRTGMQPVIEANQEAFHEPGLRDFFPGVTRAAQAVARTGRAAVNPATYKAIAQSVGESAKYVASMRLALPGSIGGALGGSTLTVGAGGTAAALAPAVLAAAAGAGGYEAGRRIYTNAIEPWQERRMQERVGKINATGNKVARDYETMVKGREARVAKFKAHPGAAVALQRLREDPSLVDAFVEKFGVNPMYVDSSFRDIGSKVKARRTK